MEYTKLGDTKISRLVFGCWAMGGHGWGSVKDNDSIQAVKMALDLGINFFDTADVYGFGHSERTLTQALGSKRHDVVIATKFGVTWDNKANIGRDCSPKYMVKALEASLKRLKLDCIPLYQLHWPDNKTPIDEVMRALQKCQEQGKIRYIGCSNLQAKELQAALSLCDVKTLQLPFSLLEHEKYNNLHQAKLTDRLGLLAYGALEKGLFSGKYCLGSVFDENDVRNKDPNFIGEKFEKNLELVEMLKTVGCKYNKTSAQVALRWILDTNKVLATLVGIKTINQVKENVGALGWSLEKADYDQLTNWLGVTAC